ncbi:ATPase family AAA domain-containing protein [Xylona heveae TC161]|uniref:ATPase family AAA domain-containing protein n=1 Tax=Xylona heveae (strain CBS 132557 / TC161) TaxID=1328760 RepID=A0A165IW50_XYLHT|nr:ATPase family AAA domain-containing protein [Xylona heveae TC161]KZF25463.1 ATPase family AAA domain-containing protein [Xylona heveae TC161]
MAPGQGPGRKFQLFQDLILIAAAQVSTYYVVRYILSRLDPESDQKEEAKRKAAASTAALRRLDGPSKEKSRSNEEEARRPRKEDLVLNQYEQTIAMDLVAPDDIAVTFEDIGGLDDIIEELKESVIYPLTLPHLYSHTSSLLSAPSGVLLYGPPGCGKTMLAKALARESGACFINLHISTLTEKWYGDSNKLVNAVFSLARKLQPAIVFIDEIDAVLGTRRSGEHEASGMVKAEFMTHWDGLTSASASGHPARILILGATNRIQDIDEAILRRMPKKFPVSLPSAHQRRRIFQLVLEDTKVDKDRFDLDLLVRATAGMSGSDIKEACRDAAMGPVRELIRSKSSRGESMDRVNPGEVRGIVTEDFFNRKGGLHMIQENLTDMGQRARMAEFAESESLTEETD